ncbi:hypothetical protein D3C87_1640970 [compost metagenome]
MNWMIDTFMPWPIMRQTMPSAAVVLPLPVPVWTMTRPRSTVLLAIMRARAAWIFFIFSV